MHDFISLSLSSIAYEIQLKYLYEAFIHLFTFAPEKNSTVLIHHRISSVNICMVSCLTMVKDTAVKMYFDAHS